MTIKIQSYRAVILAIGCAFVATSAGAAAFGDWDADANHNLSNKEFRAGFERTGAFAKWDADHNSTISKSEFDAGLGDRVTKFDSRFGKDAFTRWDLNHDKVLSDNEFYDGVYASYDKNKSKVIEEPEFGDLGDDMGDGGLWDV